MTTITLHSKVRQDGSLRLRVPMEWANAECDVTVTVQPVMHALESQGWPDGYFEATYGCLSDDPIERPSQWAYEIRDELV